MPSRRQTTPSSVRSMSRQAGADRAAAGRRGGAAESASASETRGAKGHDRVYPLAQSSLTRVGSTSPSPGSSGRERSRRSGTGRVGRRRRVVAAARRVLPDAVVAVTARAVLLRGRRALLRHGRALLRRGRLLGALRTAFRARG